MATIYADLEATYTASFLSAYVVHVFMNCMDWQIG